MTDRTDQNPFLRGPLPAIYLRTAIPIIFVMGMNGLLAVADALFLGIYVGAEALAAVTLMFPIYMVLVALATLVSGGMNSILARALGGGRTQDAQATFAGAHGLAVALGIVLVVGFLTIGDAAARLAAGGSDTLAQLGLIYLRITIFMSPLLFVLAVNSDALRSEGYIAMMAGISLVVSLANIGFNWVLIAWAGWGVAGSAWGTSAAQALALVIVLAFRLRRGTVLHPANVLRFPLTTNWARIVTLGAPQSLTFAGIALGAASVVGALQLVGAPGYGDTITAYGITTRVMTFLFLPLLGLSHAMQTITGNNFGAGAYARSDASLRIAIVAALVYCAVAQVIFATLPGQIGAMFVDDPAVISEVARILPVMTAGLILAGPLLMMSAYFQALGDAGRAALLGLTKPYLFAIPLTFALPQVMGEVGIWWAAPMAEVLLAALALMVLAQSARRSRRRFGLFHAQGGAA